MSTPAITPGSRVISDAVVLAPSGTVARRRDVRPVAQILVERAADRGASLGELASDNNMAPLLPIASLCIVAGATIRHTATSASTCALSSAASRTTRLRAGRGGCVGVFGPVVTAAALLAGQRGRGHRAGGDGQRGIFEAGASGDGADRRRRQRVDQPVQAIGVANHRGIAAHRPLQVAADQRRDVTGRLDCGGTYGVRPARRARPRPVPPGLPTTRPSSRLLDASRLAPCIPVRATSPAANSPGSSVCP